MSCPGANSIEHCQLLDEAEAPDDEDSERRLQVQQRCSSRDIEITERVPDKLEMAEVKKLKQLKKEALQHKSEQQDRLNGATALAARLKVEMKKTDKVLIDIEAKLRDFDFKLHLAPQRPGPLEWVDSNWFGAMCNLVVLLNLTFMAKHKDVHLMSPVLAKMSDNIFLSWYVIELMIKTAHHGRHLFFGKFMYVWWNWLDLGIVLSGIVDQWIMPMLGNTSGGGTLAALRLLRLFRILRFLKIIKAFLLADLSFITDSPSFEIFMSSVICVNALTIGFELDIKWIGWIWVDNVFLGIYTFDLALRLKRFGAQFFVHPDDKYWNWLDFVVVTSGMLDSWLIPTINIIQVEMLGVHNQLDMGRLKKVMSLIRLMRLLRVLRLVRVIRGVPPLYTMLIGVIEAFKSMQYVLVLVLITLYGASIIFTNLIGEGLLYDNQQAPEDALAVFGSVSQSFFSLFELMNGDTSVIEPIKDMVIGRLLFAGFMVISNWAILAILTAVVSGHMIDASKECQEETRKEQSALDEHENTRKLMLIFEENDTDGNGFISREEWLAMLNDPATIAELSEGTHLDNNDLADLYDCLAVENDGDCEGRVMYKDLVHSLKANTALADKRAILHVMLRMRICQDRLQSQVAEGFEKIREEVRAGE